MAHIDKVAYLMDYIAAMSAPSKWPLPERGIRFLTPAFMVEKYALSRMDENFGMAMDARIPMITTTINNSMRVKALFSRIAPGIRVRPTSRDR